MVLKKHGNCPFCNTEQDFQLADAWEIFINEIIKGDYKNVLINVIKRFFAIRIRNSESTPALRCIYCKKIFIECPYCNSTTLLEGEIYGRLVNCGNCKRQLEVCETKEAYRLKGN